MTGFELAFIFILFGFGKKTVHPQGAAFIHRCPSCEHEVEWQLVTIRSWFTLFFIPVIPYKTQDMVVCPRCQVTYEADSPEYKRLRRALTIGGGRA